MFLSGRFVKRAAVAAAAVLALSCSAATSSARADVISSTAAFTVPASHGYKITVLAFSRRADGRGQVMLLVGGRHAAATYSTPAIVTDASIDADLGGLGEIGLRFVPSGAVEEERSSCGDDAVQFEAGSYQGVFEFRGEEGFAEARVESVAAEVKPFLDLVCFGAGEGEFIGRGLPGARLLVRDPGRRLSLKVNENRPGARVLYGAEISEKRGRIAISRRVGGAMRTGAFSFSRGLGSALLDPSATLFSGSASFHRNAPAAHRWTGSLSIDVPGDSNVPLTGPGTTATLVPASHRFD